MSIVKISDFLNRVKNPINIEDNQIYKRITIRIKHQGVLLRDSLKGDLIGTKKQFTVKTGQFILSKIDAMNGAFGIVGENLDGAIITGNFWAFDFDKNKVNLDWFNIFTSSDEFIEICRRASSGTTHRKYLDEKKFNNYELDLPSIEQQKQIVEKIKKYQIYHNNTKINIEELGNYFEKLKQSILQDAIQGKLVPQDPNDEPAEKLLERIKAEKDRLIKEGKIRKEKPLPLISKEEIPFELPKGWIYSRFGQIAINRDGERIPLSKEQRENRKGKYSYYGASGVIDHINDYIFNKKLLLIGEDGANLINRSTPIGFTAKGKYWVNNHAHVVDFCQEETLEYFKIFINAIDLKPYVTGTAQPKMNQQKMNNIVVTLPPLSEQKRIIKKVDSLMKLCDEKEKNITEAKENIEKLNQAILREVFK